MGINPCCCISPSRGTLSIAGLQIMGACRGIISAVQLYFEANRLQSELDKDPTVKDQVFQELSKEYPGYDSMDNILTVMRILLIYGLVVNTLDVIAGSALFYAVKHERAPLIKVYLIVYAILLIPSVAIAAFLAPPTLKYIMLFCYVFYVYFLLVVYAAYLEIRNKNLLQNQNPAVAYAQA